MIHPNYRSIATPETEYSDYDYEAQEQYHSYVHAGGEEADANLTEQMTEVRCWFLL